MPDQFLGGTTDSVIGAALNGLSLRQRLISNNLANIDTPQFKASEVQFEDQLQDAIDRGRQRSPVTLVSYNPRHLPLEPARVEDVKPEIEQDEETAVRADGNNVDIDKQMVLLSETALTYNALVQLTAARLSLAKYLVNDGRR
ncbi:MAG: flagellar basal body rod protein FlgB [Bacteroidetes bacterium]|nr:flagellar basal body rod protein FlgB [Bacteroidota bacterium]MCL5025241.1 flagellar basal body rod protein FlgB [Chloroflexota bacterium]